VRIFGADFIKFNGNCMTRLFSQLKLRRKRLGEGGVHGSGKVDDYRAHTSRDPNDVYFQLQVIDRVTREISGLLEVKVICDVVQRRILTDFGFSISGVTLYEERTRSLRLQSYHLPRGLMLLLDKLMSIPLAQLSTPIDAESSYSVKAFQENRIMISSELYDFLGYQLSRKQCLLIQTSSRLNTILAFPLTVGDRVIGTLTVGTQKQKISSDVIGTIKTITAQLAVSLEYALAHQSLQNSIKFQLVSIQRISNEISKIKTVEKLLSYVVTKLSSIAGLDLHYPTIFLYSHKSHQLVLKSSSLEKGILDIVERSLGNSIFDLKISDTYKENLFVKSLINKKTYISGDFADFVFPFMNESVARFIQKLLKAKYGISIPLIAQSKMIGVLSFSFRHPIADFDKQVLETFANQVANAIHNLHLQSKLKGEIVKLERINEMKNRFLADASHELKTPLASLKGNLDVLTFNPNIISSDKYARESQFINGSIKRMDYLVNQLITLAQHDTDHSQLQYSYIDLDKLISLEIANIQILADEKEIKIKHISNDKNVPVRVDKAKMSIVLQNLFTNAIKYNKQNGEVFVDLTVLDKGFILSVRDTGIGIAKKDVGHIFDRFYRVETARNRSYGGSGLGLSICKAIVEMHKGTIEVVTSLGEGCAFTIKIPSV
jgi:signal transduction histidine kinase